MAVSPLERLSDLSTCLCAAIAEAKAGDPGNDIDPDPGVDVCWCGVVPGAGGEPPSGMVGENDEGACGIAYVRMSLAYPADQVGVQAVATVDIPTSNGLDVEVGILRGVDLDEEIPDEATLLAIADRQFSDMELIKRAISCCTEVSRKEMILGPYQPYGPFGNVVGGFWTVHVGLL